ncbi:unnamed protein product [Closterium sp. NIES-65]|nr:unnamed protein product [Closterium sp. NIES-65]
MAPAFRATGGSANVSQEPRKAGVKANASEKPATAVATAAINDACPSRVNSELAACDVAARMTADADVAAELDGNGHNHEHPRCSPVLRRKPIDVPAKMVRQLFATSKNKYTGLDEVKEDGVRDSWTESLEPESQFSDMNELMSSGLDGITFDSSIAESAGQGDDLSDVKGGEKGEEDKGGEEEGLEEFEEEIELEIEEEEVEVEEEEEVGEKAEGKEQEESDSDEDEDESEDEDEDEGEEEEGDGEESGNEGEEEEDLEEEEEQMEDGYSIVLKVGQVMLPCKVRYDNEEIVQIVEAVDDSEIVEVVDDVAENGDLAVNDVDEHQDCHGHVRTCTSLPAASDSPPRVLSLSMENSSPPAPSSPTSPLHYPPISSSPPPTESLEQMLTSPTIPTAPFPPPPKSILKLSFVERCSNATSSCKVTSGNVMETVGQKRQRDGSESGSACGGRKEGQGGVVGAGACAEARGVRPTARERVERQMEVAEAAVRMLVERCKGENRDDASHGHGVSPVPTSLANDVLHQMEQLRHAVLDITKPRKRLRFADELGKELNHIRFIQPRR